MSEVMRVERAHRRDLIVLLGGLVAVSLVVWAFRAVPAIAPTTVGLTLLLVVLVTATFGRLWVASVVAIVATGAFNFFFFPPVGTFTIADPQHWVAVIAFLVAAVIASNLSAAAQARAREADARRDEVTRLFDLTRDVLLTTEAGGAIDRLARHVARRFELSRVAICLPADHEWRMHQGGAEKVDVDTELLNQALARARGSLEFDAHSRAYGGHVRVEGRHGAVLLVPLRHGTRAVGILAAVAPMIDAGTIDAVAGVVAIAIERTQFLLEREAAELVRQKADVAATLLASLSHDLKTPLTAIRVAVENLRGELPREEREAQSGAASVELQRLTRLLQDILDMARIDAAAIHREPQWVTPADVIDAAAAQVRHALAGRRLQINADSESEVHLDPRVVSVALSHLLENAGQYSPADREITVEACVDADGLRVAVTDQGPGLDAAEIEHLFERFFRGRTARQLAPGTGMGLAISEGLLSAVNGRIWAENAPGSGARFTVIVPGPRRPVPTPV
jgi:two-component system, OmpR family, sensor histidine kinase KdpD